MMSNAQICGICFFQLFSSCVDQIIEYTSAICFTHAASDASSDILIANDDFFTLCAMGTQTFGYDFKCCMDAAIDIRAAIDHQYFSHGFSAC